MQFGGPFWAARLDYPPMIEPRTRIVTYTASRRPYGPAFPTRGVFPVDPQNPPVPPPDAIASEFVDHTGRVIGFAWVVQEHHDKDTMVAQWAWLDAKDPSPSASGGVYGPKLMP